MCKFLFQASRWWCSARRRPQVVEQVCVVRARMRTHNTHLFKRTVCGAAATCTGILPLRLISRGHKKLRGIVYNYRSTATWVLEGADSPSSLCFPYTYGTLLNGIVYLISAFTPKGGKWE